MTIVKPIRLFVNHPEKLSPRISRWRRRIVLLIALFIPGLPQMLSKDRVALGAFLGCCGGGALANLIVISGFSDSLCQAMDIFYSWSTWAVIDIYPSTIASFVESSESLAPVLPPNTPFFIQPFFREVYIASLVAYVLCAAISVWNQWHTQKSGQVSS